MTGRRKRKFRRHYQLRRPRRRNRLHRQWRQRRQRRQRRKRRQRLPRRELLLRPRRQRWTRDRRPRPPLWPRRSLPRRRQVPSVLWASRPGTGTGTPQLELSSRRHRAQKVPPSPYRDSLGRRYPRFQRHRLRRTGQRIRLLDPDRPQVVARKDFGWTVSEVPMVAEVVVVAAVAAGALPTRWLMLTPTTPPRLPTAPAARAIAAAARTGKAASAAEAAATMPPTEASATARSDQLTSERRHLR